MYYLDDAGVVHSILASCTDAGGVDPCVEIAGGRSFFRCEDLLRLAKLLEALESEGGDHV